MGSIETKFNKIAHEHDEADQAWKDEEADEAAARHASRAKTQAAFAKKAEDEENAYQARMGEIAIEKAAADHAQHEYEADMQESEEEQDRMDVESAADEKADAEIKECATDGTECQTDDGNCHKLSEHLFMACDGYSCAHSDPGDCYHNWAHIPAALPRTPLKPKSAKCTQLLGKIPSQFHIEEHPTKPEDHPLIVIGCAQASRKEMIDGLDAYMTAAEECPPFCMPGSATATKDGDTAHGMQHGAQDTNGLCVPDGAMAQLKENLDDLPVYKNSGTNGRFKGGISTTTCTFVKSTVSGWLSGLGDDSSELLQSPTSAEHAAAQAKEQEEAAAAGKAEEDKQAAIEAEEHAAAKQSAKEVADDEAAAEKANAAEEAKMNSDAADATKAMMAANAATAKAEAANDKKQEEYKNLEAHIAAEQGKADKASAARKTKVEGEIAANDAEIAKDKKEAAAAATAAAAANAAHEKNLAKIDSDYEDEAKAIKDKEEKDEADFDTEAKDIHDKFAGKAHNNMEKWAEEKAALAEEKKNDEAAAATEKKSIETKFNKIAHEHDEADQAWKDEEADEAAARHASRAKTQAAFAKKAEDEENAYQARMGEIAIEKTAADHAQHEYEADMQESEEEQDRMDAESAAYEKADAEIKECATDGTECQTDDGNCHKLSEHLFMACDGYSCAHSDPGDCYHNWAHIPAALPRTPLKPKTEKCKKLLAKIPSQFHIEEHPTRPEDHPLIVIGCAEASRKEMIDGLDAYMTAAEECPPFCMPGSATHTQDGDTAHGMQHGAQDTNGLCVPDGAMAQLKENLDDLPVYKNSGTNGRFKGGISTTTCTFVKSTVSGWLSGLGDDSSLIQPLP